MTDENGELMENEPPTKPPNEKPMHVYVHKDGESKAEKTLKKLALMEYDKHIEKLIEQYPSYEEQIRETSPTEIEKLEIQMLKETQKTGKKVSSGIVTLPNKDSGIDRVDALLKEEFSSQSEMMKAFGLLLRDKSLSHGEQQKLKNVADNLWKKFREEKGSVPHLNMEMEHFPPSKTARYIVCRVCGKNIPDYQIHPHLESHENKTSQINMGLNRGR